MTISLAGGYEEEMHVPLITTQTHAPSICLIDSLIQCIDHAKSDQADIPPEFHHTPIPRP